VQLFTGQYRSSGKTFLAHLCGTAAIVQAAGGSVDETLAALLHAAYLQGDFGDGRQDATPRKRSEVREAVGADAEVLVAQYATWPWRSRLRELRDHGAGTLEEWERPLAFLRLANEVEEHVDFANDYCPNHAAHVFPLADVVRCAGYLGRDELGRLAQELADQLSGHTVPPSLQLANGASGVVSSRSVRIRLPVRWARDGGVVRWSVRRVPGARRVVHAWREWRPTSRSA
jgi:hypothetical protein